MTHSTVMSNVHHLYHSFTFYIDKNQTCNFLARCNVWHKNVFRSHNGSSVTETNTILKILNQVLGVWLSTKRKWRKFSQRLYHSSKHKRNLWFILTRQSIFGWLRPNVCAMFGKLTKSCAFLMQDNWNNMAVCQHKVHVLTDLFQSFNLEIGN